jgi:hypothetical protein
MNDDNYEKQDDRYAKISGQISHPQRTLGGVGLQQQRRLFRHDLH